MTIDTFPLWVTIPGTVLLVLAGLAIVAGSLGLLRFPDFFARVHGPSMSSTAGAAGVLITSMLSSSAIAERLMIHELLFAVLLIGTAPVTSIVMLQAALYRNRARHKLESSTREEEVSNPPEH